MNLVPTELLQTNQLIHLNVMSLDSQLGFAVNLPLFSANGWSECDEQGPRPRLQVLHLPVRAARGQEERRNFCDQGFLSGNIQREGKLF